MIRAPGDFVATEPAVWRRVFFQPRERRGDGQLASGRDEVFQPFQATGRVRQAVNEICQQHNVESPEVRPQIAGVANLETNPPPVDLRRNLRHAGRSQFPFVGPFVSHVMSVRQPGRRCDEAAREIDSQHFLASPRQFKARTTHRAPEVQSARGWRQRAKIHAFRHDPHRKIQRIRRSERIRQVPPPACRNETGDTRPAAGPTRTD